MREWLVYVAVMGMIFGGLALAGLIELSLGAVAGLLISGPLYLLLGGALAKLGYQRKTLRDLRAESATAGESSSGGATTTVATTRPRPAPTRRTSTGRSQHPRRTTRQRRR